MLKQKFLVDFGAKVAVYFMTAVTGIVVARVAGPEVVGMIGYATAYVSIFSFVTGMCGPAHIKMVSEGQSEENCNYTFAILSAVATTIFATLVIGYFFIQKFVFDHEFTRDMELVMGLTLSSSIISNLSLYSQTVFVARNEQARSNAPEFIRAIVYNIGRIIIVVLGMKAVAISSINLASVLILLPFQFFLFKKIKFGIFDKKLAKKYLLLSLPIFTVVVVNALFTYSDKLILEHFGDIKAIGYYTAASSIGGMLILLGNTAGSVFFPVFSGLFAKNDYEGVRIKIRQFERFIFVFILPIIMGLAIFSHAIIITLLGDKYTPSVHIFSILVISSFFVIWGMPYGNVLSGLGLFWLNSTVNFVQFIVFVATLYVTIYPGLLNLGVMALALTQLVINVFLFVTNSYLAWNKIKVNYLSSQIKFVLFWTLIWFSFHYLLSERVNEFSNYTQAFIILPIFMLLILLFQLTLGLLKRSDIEILKELVNPKKGLKYVTEELKNN